MTSKLIAEVLMFILQELLWRTRAFSQHFDQWTKQGYEFDETLKTEALKPAQEALMKLFAVSLERNQMMYSQTCVLATTCLKSQTYVLFYINAIKAKHISFWMVALNGVITV